MNERLQALLDEIRQLEQNVADELGREKDRLGYQFQHGRVQSEHEVQLRHRKLAVDLSRYLHESRWPVTFTAPVIYALIVPLVVLDACATAYQWLCFPIYKIPRVARRDYMDFDRAHCAYCTCANGVLAYTGEIGARTEQYWCPIKHAQGPKSLHSRYQHFFAYGDAEQYATHLEALRQDFRDLVPVTNVTPRRPPST